MPRRCCFHQIDSKRSGVIIWAGGDSFTSLETIRGGLVLDGGRGAHTVTPPLLSQMQVPDDWRFILAGGDSFTSFETIRGGLKIPNRLSTVASAVQSYFSLYEHLPKI